MKIGRKQPEIVDTEKFRRLFGFDSKYYLDYLTLKGDPSDNIKGIPGIGKKTAQKLVSDYGSIENIYAHTFNVQKKIKNLLFEYEEYAKSTYDLLKIDTSIEITDANLFDYLFQKSDELKNKTNYLLTCVGINTK